MTVGGAPAHSSTLNPQAAAPVPNASAGAPVIGVGAGTAGPRVLPEFILLAAIWGSSFLFMKIGAAQFGPMPTAALRVGIAALFLLPIVLLRGQTPLLRKHWRALFAIGLINSGIPFVLFSYALLWIPTSLTAIINATVPMFGALIAWLWFGDRLNRAQTIGLVLGFVGVALLAFGRSGGSGPAGGASAVFAILASTLACVSYGIAANASKRWLYSVPALVSAAGSLLGATVGLALPAIWLWPATPPDLKAWGALIAVGVLCTAIAYILFFRLIERAGATRALTVTYLVPLFALSYGVLLLGERVTWWMVGCGLVIVLGTALTTGRVRFTSMR